MAVPSQLTKPVRAKTALQVVAVVAEDALMVLAANSVAVAVAAVVVMTVVAAPVVVAAVDAAISAVVNSSLSYSNGHRAEKPVPVFLFAGIVLKHRWSSESKSRWRPLPSSCPGLQTEQWVKEWKTPYRRARVFFSKR